MSFATDPLVIGCANDPFHDCDCDSDLTTVTPYTKSKHLADVAYNATSSNDNVMHIPGKVVDTSTLLSGSHSISVGSLNTSPPDLAT